MDKKLHQTEIISLEEKDFWNRIPESRGVYFIHS